MQSGGGFQESDASEVELTGLDGPVLQLLVAYIYGKLGKIPDDLLLPLFLAADVHQVVLCNSVVFPVHPKHRWQISAIMHIILHTPSSEHTFQKKCMLYRVKSNPIQTMVLAHICASEAYSSCQLSTVNHAYTCPR